MANNNVTRAEIANVLSKDIGISRSESSYFVDTIINEIKSQFSFYWYHFFSCQLLWLKMWPETLVIIVVATLWIYLMIQAHGMGVNPIQMIHHILVLVLQKKLL